MEWLLADENKGLLEIQNEESGLISWITAEKKKRGLQKESFEIVRLLEEELPETEFQLYDARERGSFNTSNFDPQRKKAIPAEKTIARAAGRHKVAPGEIVTCSVDLAMVHDDGCGSTP